MLKMYTLSFLLILEVLRAVTSDCTPNPINNCQATCQLSNGTVVLLDISDTKLTYPLIIISAGADDSEYFTFSPCRGTRCQQLNAFNSTVCQHESNGRVYSCGQLGTAYITWSLVSISPHYQFNISYSGGDCIPGGDCKQAVFTFEQNSNPDVSITYTPDNQSIYIFHVSGECVGQPNCVVKESNNNYVGIVGFILILLLIAGVVTYFIVGALVMKFHKGAQGRELVPNYTLWVDLPLLIKDGCLFVISPCYRQNKNLYESI